MDAQPAVRRACTTLVDFGVAARGGPSPGWSTRPWSTSYAGSPRATPRAPWRHRPSQNPTEVLAEPVAERRRRFRLGRPRTSDWPTAPPSDLAAGAAQAWLHRLHGALGRRDRTGDGPAVRRPRGRQRRCAYDRPLLVARSGAPATRLAPWAAAARHAGRRPAERLPDRPGPSATCPGRAPCSWRTPASAAGRARGAPRSTTAGSSLSSSGAAEGGPGPVDPLSSIAVRQRILSEAALRLARRPAAARGRRCRPARPRCARASSAGLDVDWLHLTTLDGATAASTDGRQRRPGSGPQLADGLGLERRRAIAEANQTIAHGATLQSVLVGNTVLRREIFDETAGNTSYTAAEDPFAARQRGSGRPRPGCTGNLEGVAPRRAREGHPRQRQRSLLGHWSATRSTSRSA